jgi:sugar phosphate isomerase/epimerase
MHAPISRRQFVASAAAAAACGSLGRSRIARAAEQAGFSIGIQSFSLRGYSIDEAIAHSKKLGFEHIELSKGHLDPAASPETVDAVTSKIRAAGLKTLGHGVNKFTKDDAANRALFEFARRAGLRNLTADPDPDAFDSLDSLVKEFDIRIAIHNHGPRHRYNKALDVLAACEGRDARIGACADLGHYIRSGERPTDVIRLLEGRLYGIHLKDFAEMKDKTEGVILGRGHLDVDGVFMALAQVGFPADGCLSIEYEENPENPIDDIRQCLEVAQAAAKKATG